MSTIAIALKHMLAAGMDHDAIINAVAEMEANSAPKKSANAIRQERYRRNKALHVTDSNAPLDKEKVTQKEINPPKEKTPKGVQKKGSIGVREQLSICLDAERAQAVIDHRQRLRKPLTERAAKLLTDEFGKFEDPNSAADLMISRGWQGFESSWGDNAGLRRVPAQTTPILVAVEETDEAWIKRLNLARPSETWWYDVWGPAPGQEGCRVPAHLLIEKDFRRHWDRPYGAAA